VRSYPSFPTTNAFVSDDTGGMIAFLDGQDRVKLDRSAASATA
jgi:hypothetical protein